MFQPQRILSRSPLRTQSHTSAAFLQQFEEQKQPYQYRNAIKPTDEIWKSKYIELETIKQKEISELMQALQDLKNGDCNTLYQQNEELKQVVNEYQRSVHNLKGQLEEQQIMKDAYLKQIKELTDMTQSLRAENVRLGQLLRESKNELENMSSKVILEDFNKQFESKLKLRIEQDIKDIHNRYLREINQLKQKIVEYEKLINQSVQQIQPKQTVEQNIKTQQPIIQKLQLQSGNIDGQASQQSQSTQQTKSQLSQQLQQCQDLSQSQQSILHTHSSAQQQSKPHNNTTSPTPTQQLLKKIDDLVHGIENKNNYIDDLLLKYGDLEEQYQNLKMQFDQNCSTSEQREVVITQLLAELENVNTNTQQYHQEINALLGR